MSIKDFLKKQKRSIGGALAAVTVFAGGMTNAQASERIPPAPPSARKTSQNRLHRNTTARIDDACLSIVRTRLIQREGNVPHFYFDKNGILHTGIGLNVNAYRNFQKLDLEKDGRLLSLREKNAFFAEIREFQRKQAKNGFNYNARYYASSFAVRPTKASRDKMFSRLIAHSMSEIKRMLGTKAYYNLHPIAQAETIMMHYNMGSPRFNPQKWPIFFSAAKRADYATMSKHCHTKGVSEERNKAVATAFKNLANRRYLAQRALTQNKQL